MRRIKRIAFCILLLGIAFTVSAQNDTKQDGKGSIWDQSRPRVASSIESLRQKLAADPDNVSLQLDLGRTYYSVAVKRRGTSYSDAQKIFEKILERDPNNATALAYHGSILGLNISNNLVADGLIQATAIKATQELDRAVEIAPDSIEIRQMRGYHNYYTPSSYGRDRLAVEDFTHVIALLERFPDTQEARGDAYLILGDCYRKMKDIANAQAAWKNIGNLVPGTPLAATAEARIATLTGVQTDPGASVKELTAFFGFLIGTLIFSILAFLLLRDLIRTRRWVSGAVISLVVSAAAFLWNIINLIAVVFSTVGLVKDPTLALFASSARHDLYLLCALSPIPFGLIIAYRAYKATFMDIVLKRGLSLLAVLLMSMIYTRLVKLPLFWTISQVPNDVLRSIYYSGIWLWVWALYPPMTVWINRAVDRYLFKRRDYSKLLDWFNGRLGGVTDEASLVQTSAESFKEAFAANIVEYLKGTDKFAIRLFAAMRASKSTVMLKRDFADREIDSELERHHAELVMVVTSGDEAMAIILIGPRSFGQGYLSEELSVLRSLSTQIGRTLENLRLQETRRQQAIAEEELRKMTAFAELKALRAQIDPHFFFNALNSVASLISDNPEAAEELLENISELFRQSFRPSREFVSLDQELSLIETYLKVEKVRLGSKLQFSEDISADALPTRIPALSIQPLIENAVKHGIGRSNLGGNISLSAKIEDSHLNVIVADSGVGISQSKLTHVFSDGVGLANVNNRLIGLYGDDSALRIESVQGSGTTVSFAIPL